MIFNYNGLARLWSENFNFYNGSPGILRLFNEQLGGQMGWILSPALLGACVAIWQLGREAPTEKVSRRNALVLWLAWLIPSIIYFSISTFFHGYYLATTAPAVAALFGIGALALWKQWQQADRRQQIVVLIILLICCGVQIVLLLPYPGWNTWLSPLIGGASLLGLVGLFAFQHWRSKLQSMAFAWCQIGRASCRERVYDMV